MLDGPGMKAQEIANLAWSLAVMGDADISLLAHLLRSAQEQRRSLTLIESHQLYQASSRGGRGGLCRWGAYFLAFWLALLGCLSVCFLICLLVCVATCALTLLMSCRPVFVAHAIAQLLARSLAFVQCSLVCLFICFAHLPFVWYFCQFIACVRACSPLHSLVTTR